MSDIQGTVFLSHSSKDKLFVERVYNRLDAGGTFYDVKTIQPGQAFLDAMKSGVARGAIFVLFHSPNTKDTWVEYETQLAELSRASKRNTAILVCPIGGETHQSLPEWMKGFMTTTAEYTISDITRQILRLQRNLIRERSGKQPPFVGREDLLNRIHLALIQAVPNTGTPIQHLILTGLVGMGRTSVAERIISKSFSMMRESGPTFDLPEMSEAVDLYIALKEDLDGLMSKDELIRQISAFQAFAPSDQAAIIFEQVRHWADINQPIVVRTRWGLRDRDRRLKPWLDEFIRITRTHPALRIIYISERRLPDEEIAARNNVAQFNVPQLTDVDIQVLLSELVEPRFFDARKSAVVSRLILGHASTAHYLALLVNSGRSMETIESNPDPILAFQSRTLDSIINDKVLSDVQLKIISLLGLFPKLSFRILAQILEITKKELSAAIWDLTDFSLLQTVDADHISCPDMVASRSRRDLREIYTPLLAEIKDKIETEISRDTADSQLTIALLIAAVELSGDIPDELVGLLTSSSLLTIVKGQFDRARSQRDNSKAVFESIYKISKIAMSMKVSDDAVEQILFTGGDSAVRAGILPDDILTFMEKNALPSVYYLRGSYAFYVDRDLDKAILNLKKALSLKHFKLRNSRLLARAYIRNQNFSDALAVLNGLSESQVQRESGLLILKIRALRGLRLFKEADDLEASLRSDHDDFGEIALFRAGKALREMNLSEAKAQLEVARQAPRVNQFSCQLLECAVRLEGGDASLLPGVVEMANSVNRQFDAFQLQARLAVVEGRWADAESFLAKIDKKDYYDLQIERRCIELKMQDLTIVRDAAALVEAKARLDEIARLSATSPEGYRDV